MFLVEWQWTWHRVWESLSSTQCAADWPSAVNLITLCLLAVTLRWEGDTPNPRGNICMSVYVCECLHAVHVRISHNHMCTVPLSTVSWYISDGSCSKHQYWLFEFHSPQDMLCCLLGRPHRVLSRWQCFMFCCAGQVFISYVSVWNLSHFWQPLHFIPLCTLM